MAEGIALEIATNLSVSGDLPEALAQIAKAFSDLSAQTQSLSTDLSKIGGSMGETATAFQNAATAAAPLLDGTKALATDTGIANESAKQLSSNFQRIAQAVSNVTGSVGQLRIATDLADTNTRSTTSNMVSQWHGVAAAIRETHAEASRPYPLLQGPSAATPSSAVPRLPAPDYSGAGQYSRPAGPRVYDALRPTANPPPVIQLPDLSVPGPGYGGTTGRGQGFTFGVPSVVPTGTPLGGPAWYDYYNSRRAATGPTGGPPGAVPPPPPTGGGSGRGGGGRGASGGSGAVPAPNYGLSHGQTLGTIAQMTVTSMIVHSAEFQAMKQELNFENALNRFMSDINVTNRNDPRFGEIRSQEKNFLTNYAKTSRLSEGELAEGFAEFSPYYNLSGSDPKEIEKANDLFTRTAKLYESAKDNKLPGLGGFGSESKALAELVKNFAGGSDDPAKLNEAGNAVNTLMLKARAAPSQLMTALQGSIMPLIQRGFTPEALVTDVVEEYQLGQGRRSGGNLTAIMRAFDHAPYSHTGGHGQNFSLHELERVARVRNTPAFDPETDTDETSKHLNVRKIWKDRGLLTPEGVPAPDVVHSQNPILAIEQHLNESLKKLETQYSGDELVEQRNRQIAENMATFGTKAVGALSGAYDPEFDKRRAALNTSVHESMQTGVQGQLDFFKDDPLVKYDTLIAKFSDAVRHLAEQALPAFTSVVEKLTGSLASFIKWIDAHPNTATLGIGSIIGLTVFNTLATAVTAAITVFGRLSGGITGSINAVRSIGSGLSTLARGASAVSQILGPFATALELAGGVLKVFAAYEFGKQALLGQGPEYKPVGDGKNEVKNIDQGLFGFLGSMWNWAVEGKNPDKDAVRPLSGENLTNQLKEDLTKGGSVQDAMTKLSHSSEGAAESIKKLNEIIDQINKDHPERNLGHVTSQQERELAQERGQRATASPDAPAVPAPPRIAPEDRRHRDVEHPAPAFDPMQYVIGPLSEATPARSALPQLAYNDTGTLSDVPNRILPEMPAATEAERASAAADAIQAGMDQTRSGRTPPQTNQMLASNSPEVYGSTNSYSHSGLTRSQYDTLVKSGLIDATKPRPQYYADTPGNPYVQERQETNARAAAIEEGKARQTSVPPNSQIQTTAAVPSGPTPSAVAPAAQLPAQVTPAPSIPRAEDSPGIGSMTAEELTEALTAIPSSEGVAQTIARESTSSTGIPSSERGAMTPPIPESERHRGMGANAADAQLWYGNGSTRGRFHMPPNLVDGQHHIAMQPRPSHHALGVGATQLANPVGWGQNYRTRPATDDSADYEYGGASAPMGSVPRTRSGASGSTGSMSSASTRTGRAASAVPSGPEVEGSLRGGAANATFAQKAPQVMASLMRDLHLTKEQAAGIVGNLGHESGGFRIMQEINPQGGRGGLGWAQWTGPRRVAYEKFAAEHHLSTSSDEANYKFLVHELQTTERNSLNLLRRETTVAGATQSFETNNERAGVVNMASRDNYAAQAVAAFNANPQVGQEGVQPAGNAIPTLAETGPAARAATGHTDAGNVLGNAYRSGFFDISGRATLPDGSRRPMDRDETSTIARAALDRNRSDYRVPMDNNYLRPQGELDSLRGAQAIPPADTLKPVEKVPSPQALLDPKSDAFARFGYAYPDNSTDVNATIHNHHYLDGEHIASNTVEHFIRNTDTANRGVSGFDPLMSPTQPGPVVTRA